MQVEEEIETVLLVGRTGSGKSQLGNDIVGQEVFQVGNTLISETTELHEFQCTVIGIQKRVNIVDTCGFRDNRKHNLKKILDTAIDLVNKSKDGFRAVLFCVEQKDRFDGTDIEDLKSLRALFGPHIFKYLHFVVTKMDRCKNYEEKECIIAKYERDIPKLLKKHNIELPNPIIYTGRTDRQSLVQVLQRTFSLDQEMFQSDLPAKIQSFKDSTNNPVIKRLNNQIITTLKMEEEIYEEAKDEGDIEQKALIREQRSFHQVLDNYRERDLVTILNSIKDDGGFYNNLANFFLNQDITKESTLIHLAHKILDTYDDILKEDAPWAKKSYIELLITELNDKLILEVIKVLGDMTYHHINKHRVSYHRDIGQLSYNVFNDLLLTISWVGGGIATVSGITALSYLLRGGQAVAAVAGEAAGAGAAVGGAAGASLGLLIPVGIMVTIIGFLVSKYVFSRKGLIKDIAKEAAKQILSLEATKDLVIGLLIFYSDYTKALIL